MQAVLLGWKMYELTHDPLFLGFIGLTAAIPALSLALYAGYLVDRSRPIVVYRRVIEGALLSGLVLLVSQLPQAGLNNHQQVLALFLASFIAGIARGFSQPSVYAIVPRIIPREDLQRASAWMTSALQIARISGPALGGFLFGWLGMPVAASVLCVFLVLALCNVFLLKVRIDPPAKPAKHKPVLDELLAGARYVFKHRILFPALTLDMVAVLFGGVTALLPIFASDILMVGPKGLGVLRAAPAVGAVLTSYWMTRKDLKAQAGTYLFSSVAGFGISVLVFGLSHNFILSLVALALSGAFDSVSMVIRTSAVQLSSPDSMRGRISAVNSIFIGSSNEIGEFESGMAAKLMGTVPSVLFGGAVCLITVVAAAVVSPSLRKLHLGQLKAEE